MLNFIRELAAEAGNMAKTRRETLGTGGVYTKGTETDVVTDVDRDVEAFILQKIAEKTPDYDILGEETGRHSSGSRWCWVIDPIDGTVSFVHNLHYYSVSIALCCDGAPVYAAVCAPKLGEIYYAERGKGAYCNGQRLQVSRCQEPVKAVVATGFACIRAKMKHNNLPVFNQVALDMQGIRRCGSAALDLCLVASGGYEAFWEKALEPYDIAAGVLMVQEAGGKVTDYRGGDNYPKGGIIATNGLFHPIMLDYLKDEII